MRLAELQMLAEMHKPRRCVWVNPDHVVSIEQEEGNQYAILTISGACIRVTDAMPLIEAAKEQQA